MTLFRVCYISRNTKYFLTFACRELKADSERRETSRETLFNLRKYQGKRYMKRHNGDL